MLKGPAHRGWLGLACVSLAWAAGAEEAVTVRVLPQPLATNREPFRIGLQLGFPAENAGPLRAECLSGRAVFADTNVTVETVRGLNTGKPVYRIENASKRAGGLLLQSAALRRNTGYVVRLRCRLLKGTPSMMFTFALAGAGEAAGVAAEKATAVKGESFVERAFAVRPNKDGAYRCGFQAEAGGVMEFSDFSMLPDDAVGGWSAPALEAVRALGLAAVRWPVAGGAAPYNWYQGVGPLAVRQPPGPAPAAAWFGTAEFVQFCRLVGAEPLLRVTVPEFGKAGVDVEKTREGVQLAADWAAYCDAPEGHPLARLRTRHGSVEPLRVSRWELFTPEGEVFEGVAREYREAMRAAVPLAGLSVAGAEAPLAGVRDRYVSEVLRRLQAADAAERDYFAGWYEALSLLNDALDRLRKGAGLVFWPGTQEELLNPSPDAKHMLTERGLLIALVNRFPARVPLVTEGAPASPQAPFQAVAAWTEGGTELVVYVYNSGTESRQVRVDLTALKKPFSFWAAEQLAADLTSRRRTPAVPVLRRQKAGSALRQVVLFESLPASFSRIVVKE